MDDIPDSQKGGRYLSDDRSHSCPHHTPSEYKDENGTFDNVKEYDKYHFYLPEKVEDGNIVIVPKEKELDFNSTYKNVHTINQFTIYEY